MEFLGHVTDSMGRLHPDVEHLIYGALKGLQNIRQEGDGSINIASIPEHFTRMFNHFAHEPKFHAFLSAVAYSQARCQPGLVDEDVEDPSINDPLRLFFARRIFRDALERMMCSGPYHKDACQCQTLKDYYGTKIYYCNQYSCHAYRNGFASKEERDRHWKKFHQRPHKCSVETCLFAKVGFRDPAGLQRHTQKHEYATQPFQTPGDAAPGSLLILPFSNEDVIKSLEDAVALDQLDILQGYLSKVDLPNQICENLVWIASLAASTVTLHLLLQRFDELIKSGKLRLQNSLAASLELEKFENIKLLLAWGANFEDTGSEEVISPIRRRPPLSYNTTSPSPLACNYTRALSLWSPKLMTFLTDECHIDIYPKKTRNLEAIFSRPAIWGTTVDDARERFYRIKRFMHWQQVRRICVPWAAQSGCALSLMICLENEADPNGGCLWELSALYYAVQLGGKEGAEMVKLLLRSGADPEAVAGSDPANVKLLEEAFGCSWEEMVSRIRAGEDLRHAFQD
ncbi:hypothetical protein F4819DRAFT_510258 [Hypoxylon fuscum]|nr:hypothetical protein F4819DRAFT_510258 [Hypoxylon fuscum]